jgi:hypothetical protein
MIMKIYYMIPSLLISKTSGSLEIRLIIILNASSMIISRPIFELVTNYMALMISSISDFTLVYLLIPFSLSVNLAIILKARFLQLSQL